MMSFLSFTRILKIKSIIGQQTTLAKLVNLVIIILLTAELSIAFFYSWYSALAFIVPSGDDMAVHSYIIRYRTSLDAYLNRAFQYPNIIHLMLYLADFKDLLLIPKVLGAIMFVTVFLGLLIYAFFFKHYLTNTIQGLSVLTGSLLLFLLCPVSLKRTVIDGSLMELIDVLLLLPLCMLLFNNNRFFLTGFLYGLSMLNYLGFIEVSVFLLPAIFYRIIRRNLRFKQLAILFSSFMLGGNFMIPRFISFLYRRLPLILRPGPQGSLQEILSTQSASSIGVLGVDAFTLIMVVLLSISLISLTLSVYERRPRIAVASFSCVLLLLMALVVSVVQVRPLRLAFFLLPLFIYYILVSIIKIISSRLKLSSNAVKLLNAVCPIIFIVILFSGLIAASSFIGISLDSPLSPQPLIRLDHDTLEVYRHLCKLVGSSGSGASTILYIGQTSPWLPYILREQAPNSRFIQLNMWILSKFKEGDASSLGEILYGSQGYLVIEGLRPNQWYYESTRALVNKALSIELPGSIGQLMLKGYYGGKMIVIWYININEANQRSP